MILCALMPANLPGEEAYFVERLYPLMEAAQCNLCHNDNGVASGTLLEFPGPQADAEQITAFGLKLLDLVDREQPDQSLLILKPTNREEHSGGERIEPGSDLLGKADSIFVMTFGKDSDALHERLL